MYANLYERFATRHKGTFLRDDESVVITPGDQKTKVVVISKTEGSDLLRDLLGSLQRPSKLERVLVVGKNNGG